MLMFTNYLINILIHLVKFCSKFWRYFTVAIWLSLLSVLTNKFESLLLLKVEIGAILGMFCLQKTGAEIREFLTGKWFC